MPELPEVQTTVNGLRKHIVGLRIENAWSDYDSKYFKGSQTIKDPSYFLKFKKMVLGKKIISVDRRAKNILINLEENLTVLVHMKMTGHLLYGKYILKKEKGREKWVAIEPESLKDPFNRHIHFVLTFQNGKHLALADVRKFAKVAVEKTSLLASSLHLKHIGPEPLDTHFTYEIFSSRLDLRKNAPIKLVLMDQEILAGVGNIYADETLWRAGVHPLKKTGLIGSSERKKIYEAMKKVLSQGIKFGGDSMSDYRNIHGEKGAFQENHEAYKRKGEKCRKKGCGGIIERIVVGGRSTHFCNKHQRNY